MLASAWLRLFVVDIALRLASFQNAETFLGSRARTGPGGKPPDPEVERIVWLVGVAARFHPLRIRCLQRALCARWILAARGVTTDLRIGVEKQNGELHAHAWLEYEGRPVGERERIEDEFQVLLDRPGS